ncbi:MAG: hypothetical protein IVW54_07865 [Candidatus Binataceae bacterium]|nr:hypothetical protein [Candidatus Binataceae bacterium]
MRLLKSNSAVPKGPGHRRAYLSFQQALIFSIGAAFGSILATLIGLDYASWIIIAVCWPMALLFGFLQRPRERRPRVISAARPWRMKAARTFAPTPRPRQRPKSGLRRVK